MKRILIVLALTTAAAPAMAADFSFVRDDGTENPFTFSIATSPTPDGSSATSFDIDGVSTNEAGPYGTLIYNADYRFHTDADGGGFENGFTAYFSRPVFGGTTAVPVFYNGVYKLSDFGGGPSVASLTITNAADAPGGVPEPASWALMIAGFGAAGTALRRRSGLVSV